MVTAHTDKKYEDELTKLREEILYMGGLVEDQIQKAVNSLVERDSDLANTGYHTWKLPSQIPGKVYLKMSITDLAGNTAVAESAEPVTIDLTEPEAKITGLK